MLLSPTTNQHHNFTPLTTHSKINDHNVLNNRQQAEAALGIINYLPSHVKFLNLEKIGSGIASITVRDLSIAELTLLQQLEYLYLGNNQLTEQDISNWRNSILSSRKLRTLNLARNAIRVLPNISYLDKLKKLNLRDNPLENFNANHLPKSLDSLKLNNSQLKELSIDKIKQQLQEAGFVITGEVSENGIIFLHHPDKYKKPITPKNSGLKKINPCSLTQTNRIKAQPTLQMQFNKVQKRIKIAKLTGTLDLTGIQSSRIINQALWICHISKLPITKINLTDCSLKNIPKRKVKYNHIVKIRRDYLINAGAIQVKPSTSQSKGKILDAIEERYGLNTTKALCSGFATEWALQFLINGEIISFLRKLYPTYKVKGEEGAPDRDIKGSPDKKILDNIFNLHEEIRYVDNIGSETYLKNYLNKHGVECAKIYTAKIEESDSVSYKESLTMEFSTWLEKCLLVSTKETALTVGLKYKSSGGHRIAFYSSGKENDEGKREIYFFDPNVGTFKIEVDMNNDVDKGKLARCLTIIVDNPTAFNVSQLKKQPRFCLNLA